MFILLQVKIASNATSVHLNDAQSLACNIQEYLDSVSRGKRVFGGECSKEFR